MTQQRKKPITSVALLGRLCAMEQRLLALIGDIRECLFGESKRAETRLLERLDRIETRMDTMKIGVGCLEANLTRQIDGIDQRLDAIELEKLPVRVAALEGAAGATAPR